MSHRTNHTWFLRALRTRGDTCDSDANYVSFSPLTCSRQDRVGDCTSALEVAHCLPLTLPNRPSTSYDRSGCYFLSYWRWSTVETCLFFPTEANVSIALMLVFAMLSFLGIRLSLSTRGPQAAQSWWERWDSNPHGVTRKFLKLLRLPVPPRSRSI